MITMYLDDILDKYPIINKGWQRDQIFLMPEGFSAHIQNFKRPFSKNARLTAELLTVIKDPWNRDWPKPWIHRGGTSWENRTTVHENLLVCRLWV